MASTTRDPIRMLPKVVEYTGTHLICGKCHERVTLDSHYHVNPGNGCSYLLESMYVVLTFRCRNDIKGCDFKSNGMGMMIHERTCEFSSYYCVLRQCDPCTWIGPKDQIISHVMECHPKSVFNSNKKVFVLDQQKRNHTEAFIMRTVFLAHGTAFGVFWEYDCHNPKILKVTANMLDKKFVDEDFYFELTVYIRKTRKYVLRYRSKCYYLRRDVTEWNIENCLVVHPNIIQKYCDANGDIYFQIEIIKPPPGTDVTPQSIRPC